MAFVSMTPAHAQPAEETPAIVPSVIYTAEVFGNLRGGIKSDAEYLDNLDIKVEADLEKVIGWRGTKLLVYGLANSGSRLSERLVGDIQTVSNIDTSAALRLYEAWIDQTILDGAVSLRAGLYDLNSEFDANDTAALFINSSHGIGPDFSQSGLNGPSIFPVTSLSARLEVRMKKGFVLRTAVLDGVPGDPDRPGRTTIKLGRGDGALLVGEINHITDTHKLGLGYWRYSGVFDALDVAAPAGRNNAGIYAFAQARLIADARGDGRGLKGFLRIGKASARYNPIQTYLGAGLAYTGPFGTRAADEIGIAIAHARLGAAYERQTLIAGEAARGHETKIELTYRAPLSDWLTIQPDAQYVFNPSGVVGRRNALVLGIRVEMGF